MFNLISGHAANERFHKKLAQDSDLNMSLFPEPTLNVYSLQNQLIFSHKIMAQLSKRKNLNHINKLFVQKSVISIKIHQFYQRMGDVNKITANIQQTENNMNTKNNDDTSNDLQSFTFNHAQNQKDKQSDQNIIFLEQCKQCKHCDLAKWREWLQFECINSDDHKYYELIAANI